MEMTDDGCANERLNDVDDLLPFNSTITLDILSVEKALLEKNQLTSCKKQEKFMRSQQK